MHQSSAISKHSLIQDVQSFIEELRMSSQEDFRANPGQLPDDEKVYQTNEISGLQPLAVYKSSDPNMSFSKMSLDSLPHDPSAAYAAGLIDGEGHIGIQESKGKQTSYFYVEVTIGMSEKAQPILEAMHDEFGGTINQGRDKTSEWAASLKWRIGGADAHTFLQRIQPFLMLKSPQAAVAIKLGNLVESLPLMSDRRKWTDEARTTAKSLKAEMHELNQKGPNARSAGAGWYKPQTTLFGTLEKFSEPWPKAGMTYAGAFYPQPKWERRISEIGSGLLLPTPVVPNGGRQHNLDNLTLDGNTLYRQDGSKAQMDLQTYVRMWPTPTKTNASYTSQASKDKYKCGMTLEEAVKWATPQARDYRTGHESRKNRPQQNLNDQVGGKLNPRWVEWLMDMPEGWLSCKPLEMHKWRAWCEQHGIY